jgi:DNA-binding MarR family transcriptional regulator
MKRYPFTPTISESDANATSEGHDLHAGRALTAWMRLARVYQKVDRASAERLRAWDLSVAQFDALTQIRAAEGLMQCELANRLLVTKGNISQLLDRLEARGLITRRKKSRASLLYLTDAGRALMDEVTPGHEAFIAKQLGNLSDGDLTALQTALRRLDHALS